MVSMSKAKRKEPVEPDKPKRLVLYMQITQAHEDALTAFIAAQRIKPDRTAVGLTALEELLAKEGFWPPSRPAGK